MNKNELTKFRGYQRLLEDISSLLEHKFYLLYLLEKFQMLSGKSLSSLEQRQKEDYATCQAGLDYRSSKRVKLVIEIDRG